jgi:hypothetical protein
MLLCGPDLQAIKPALRSRITATQSGPGQFLFAGPLFQRYIIVHDCACSIFNKPLSSAAPVTERVYLCQLQAFNPVNAGSVIPNLN